MPLTAGHFGSKTSRAHQEKPARILGRVFLTSICLRCNDGFLKLTHLLYVVSYLNVKDDVRLARA